jgi:hypothetical protein
VFDATQLSGKLGRLSQLPCQRQHVKNSRNFADVTRAKRPLRGEFSTATVDVYPQRFAAAISALLREELWRKRITGGFFESPQVLPCCREISNERRTSNSEVRK